MQRVGAVLAALAMIGISIWVRNVFFDDDDGGSGASGSLQLVCATELGAACEELDVDVTIEDAGVTYERLLSVPNADRDELGIDGWLTLAPWPQMVSEERARRGLAPVLDTPTGAIARSPLVIAVRTEREVVLEGACDAPVRWPCLGEQSRRPWADLAGGNSGWGQVEVGHADPTTSAVGLLVLGQATTEFFGDEPDGLSTQDLDNPELGFRTWLDALEASGVAPSFNRFLTTPTFDAVGTTEAEAGPALAAARSDIQEDVTLLYLEPVVTADVVFAATVGGSDAGESLERAVTGDDAREALAAAGWRVDGQDRSAGVRDEPALPGTSGLPSPGLLQALQERWREVA